MVDTEMGRVVVEAIESNPDKIYECWSESGIVTVNETRGIELLPQQSQGGLHNHGLRMSLGRWCCKAEWGKGGHL